MQGMTRRLIVTHHAPDLDAMGAVWLLKRFDAQHFADARVAFVDPGTTITLEAAEEYGNQLHEVTHVDTGLGEFDHHQPDRGQLRLSATALVYDHVCQLHPELKTEVALAKLVDFITGTDHFEDIYWPESGEMRGMLMLQELVRGLEYVDPHNDESQLHFGLQCLDCAYALIKEYVIAQDIIESKGEVFTLPVIGKCLAIESKNDTCVKLAQKQGFMVVIRKDPKEGHLRIKARPDAPLDLKPLADKIKSLDTVGSWYYHPSGKMLINGSRKHRNQHASPLALAQVVTLLKETYE